MERWVKTSSETTIKESIRWEEQFNRRNFAPGSHSDCRSTRGQEGRQLALPPLDWVFDVSVDRKQFNPFECCIWSFVKKPITMFAHNILGLL
ncbi:hypothetical protein EGR_07802 [Echinococcus granulosus]|uniref:Uncharacterized protein n=1 Tax=Echinococcus granulosus TaxID=6210 RepID=W6U7Y3_ECHGR|nr:hypothetical protein EGR_07802 [Echinococcus granulosus]EUB57343.1 hypothetical protein EGR_07802 [Echinococcus granulosus]